MRVEVEAFEDGFLERARGALASRPAASAILLDRHSRPRGKGLLAAWWRRPDQPPEIALLPNPWDDRRAVPLYADYTAEVTDRVIDHLARRLNGLTGADESRAYWDLLLGPLMLPIVSAVADRMLFCRTAHALAPEAQFLVERAEANVPATIWEAINGLRSDAWNAWVMARIVADLDLPATEAPGGSPAPPPAAPRDPLAQRALAVSAHLRRSLSRRTQHALLGWNRGRRLALLGQLNLTTRQTLRLGWAVRGLRRPPAPWRDTPLSGLPPASPLRGRLAESDASDPLVRTVTALLPALLPRSVLEGRDALLEQSVHRYGSASNVLHGNYAYDDLENEFMARSERAGRKVWFAQHGGSSLQLLTTAAERHELRPASVRVSWGGTGVNTRPAPNPYLSRLRDSHRGGEEVVVVEPLVPPDAFLLRFSTIPLGNQVYAEEVRLATFADSVASARQHLRLKVFPGSAGHPDRHRALAALPAPSGRGSFDAVAAISRARVAVVAYPDTPFIEAMTVGVPTIGLWDPGLWEMRDDAQPFFDELAELGVVHADPVAAARQLDRIYAEANDWWQSAEIAAARQRFLDRFAMPGDWLGAWTRLLREAAD